MEGEDIKNFSSCAGCMNDIGQSGYVTALGQDWHKECFRCSVCDDLLSTWYFEKAGLLFCQTDYWNRFGENCHKCGQLMTGPVLTAGSHPYHTDCFSCKQCGLHIEDGEPYILIGDKDLYCGSCPRQPQFSPETAPAPAPLLRDNDDDITFTSRARYYKVCVSVCRVAGVAAHLCLRAVCRSTPTRVSRGRPLVSREAPRRTTPSLSQKEPIENIQEKPKIMKTMDVNDPDSVLPKLTREKDDQIPVSPVDSSDVKKERDADINENAVKRERLFKRKVDNGGKTRVVRRKQTPSSPLMGEKSSSMSKLIDAGRGAEPAGVLLSLSRARSFRAPPPPPHRVFRAEDLVQGELLGCGFFGQVYKATHRDTNEVLVLKQLHRLDDDAQTNFLKEVAVLRSLQHPNVLRFVGVLYKERRLHLVTEYVPGGTLHQLLQDPSAPLGWARRARLARDVARGLRYLHRMSVIHRDLNSHNCLLREDQTVIVADFGLARIMQCSTAGSQRRKRYTVVGNPYWMAPEMMTGKLYDEKVDVFSFGIVLCEIIGRVSADPDFLPRRADFGLNERVFRDALCGDCPPPLPDVALAACRLDPDRRPSFEEIKKWLDAIVHQLSGPSPPAPPLLRAVAAYARRGAPAAHSYLDIRKPDNTVMKSKSTLVVSVGACASRSLCKCVSLGHVRGAFLVRATPACLSVTPLQGLSDSDSDDCSDDERPGALDSPDTPDTPDTPDAPYVPSSTDTSAETSPEIVESSEAILKVEPPAKPAEKPGFFTRTLMSPKLSRLFRTKEASETGGAKVDDKEEKSKSKFFVPRGPPPGGRYRVRPELDSDVLQTDLKLASMGKPMTPVFRRHVPGQGGADGRYSCRAPVAPRAAPRAAISRANYVSLANLRINATRGKAPPSPAPTT